MAKTEIPFDDFLKEYAWVIASRELYGPELADISDLNVNDVKARGAIVHGELKEGKRPEELERAQAAFPTQPAQDCEPAPALVPTSPVSISPGPAAKRPAEQPVSDWPQEFEIALKAMLGAAPLPELTDKSAPKQNAALFFAWARHKAGWEKQADELGSLITFSKGTHSICIHLSALRRGFIQPLDKRDRLPLAALGDYV